MPERLKSKAASLFKAGYRIGGSWPTLIALLAGFAFHTAPARLLISSLTTPPADGSFHVDVGGLAPGFVPVALAHHIEPQLAARETPFTISVGGDADLVVGALVSATTFSHLPTNPILGRSLQPGDEVARHPVVVLSERLWRRRYGADARLIGKTIRWSKKTYTVIGIMPASFWFPYRTDPVELWMPQRNTLAPNLPIT
jgi:hypothetical protein